MKQQAYTQELKGLAKVGTGVIGTTTCTQVMLSQEVVQFRKKLDAKIASPLREDKVRLTIQIRGAEARV